MGKIECVWALTCGKKGRFNRHLFWLIICVLRLFFLDCVGFLRCNVCHNLCMRQSICLGERWFRCWSFCDVCEVFNGLYKIVYINLSTISFLNCPTISNDVIEIEIYFISNLMNTYLIDLDNIFWQLNFHLFETRKMKWHHHTKQSSKHCMTITKELAKKRFNNEISTKIERIIEWFSLV